VCVVFLLVEVVDEPVGDLGGFGREGGHSQVPFGGIA
jgi:hypothetical protein